MQTPGPIARYFFVIGTTVALLFGCSDSNPPTSPMSPAPAPSPAPPPGGDISGAWIGTYKTNDNLDCDPNQILEAHATFQQNGANVTGSLIADGYCGLGYSFTGTLHGTTLSGGLTSGPFQGTAQGTLTGTTLTIEAFNSYRYDMGQLQLHR
jgi:hypothetical protein